MNPELTKYLRNVAYAMSASQGGCVTVVVIFAALFVGLWLDAELHTKPLFTLLFIVERLWLGAPPPTATLPTMTWVV